MSSPTKESGHGVAGVASSPKELASAPSARPVLPRLPMGNNILPESRKAFLRIPEITSGNDAEAGAKPHSISNSFSSESLNVYLSQILYCVRDGDVMLE